MTTTKSPAKRGKSSRSDHEKESFRRRFRRAHAQSGLTEQKLANQAGISRAAVSHIATGLSINSANLRKLADVLKVDFEWLRWGRGRSPAWLTDRSESFIAAHFRAAYAVPSAPTNILSWTLERWTKELQDARLRQGSNSKAGGQIRDERLNKEDIEIFREGYVDTALLAIANGIRIPVPEEEPERGSARNPIHFYPFQIRHLEILIKALADLKKDIEKDPEAKRTGFSKTEPQMKQLDDTIEALLARQFSDEGQMKALELLKILTQRKDWTYVPRTAM